MRDITLDGTTLYLHKKVYDQQDIFLVNCMWQQIDPSTNIIAVDLKTSFKKSVIALIKNLFPAFSSAPHYAEARNALQRDLTIAYHSIYKEYECTTGKSIGHWDVLFKHQKEALSLMHGRRVNFLAYEMRTGKTILSATYSLVTSRKRTVFVCYDVGKWNVVRDLTDRRWNERRISFDQFDFTVLDSARRKCVHAFNEKFVIINYEAMPKYLEYLKDSGQKTTDHIILDECQRVKQISTRNFKLCKELVDSLPEARITLMTGTPIMNRVDDMYAYFRLVGHPLGESRAEFDRKFITRNGTRGKITGAHNLDKLQDMMSNLMLRKRLDECVDIPKKAHIKLYFPIGDWRDAYMEAIREAMEHKGQLNESNITAVNNVMAQAKVPGAMEHIKLLVEQGEKVCVFTSYTKPLDDMEAELKDSGIGYVRIDGKLDGMKKTNAADRFNNDPECMVCIANIKAAGHSISLAGSSYMIVLNQPLQAADLKQVLFRDVLMTKTKPTTVYYCVCTGEDGERTVDEIIFDLNISKYEDANNAIDGGSAETSIENAVEKVFYAVIAQYGQVNQ